MFCSTVSEDNEALYKALRKIELRETELREIEKQPGLSSTNIRKRLNVAYKKNGRHLNERARQKGENRAPPFVYAVEIANVEAVTWFIRKKSFFHPLKKYLCKVDNQTSALIQAVQFEDDNQNTNDELLLRRRRCSQLVEELFDWGFFNLRNAIFHAELERALETAVLHNNIGFINYFFTQHSEQLHTRGRDLYERLMQITIHCAYEAKKEDVKSYFFRSYRVQFDKYHSERTRPNPHVIDESKSHFVEGSRKEPSRHEISKNSDSSEDEEKARTPPVSKRRLSAFAPRMESLPEEEDTHLSTVFDR